MLWLQVDTSFGEKKCGRTSSQQPLCGQKPATRGTDQFSLFFEIKKNGIFTVPLSLIDYFGSWTYLSVRFRREEVAGSEILQE